MFRLWGDEQRQSFIINLCGFCAGLLLLALIATVGYIVFRGSGFFWPTSIYTLTFERQGGPRETVFAQIRESFDEHAPTWVSISTPQQPYQTQVVFTKDEVVSLIPSDSTAEIRFDDGRIMLASPVSLSQPFQSDTSADLVSQVLEELAEIDAQINRLQSDHLSQLHKRLAEFDRREVSADAPARQSALQAFNQWQQQIDQLEAQKDGYLLRVMHSDGALHSLPMADIAQVVYPNRYNWLGKTGYALTMLAEFLTQPPKQANTAGGVFPALFGTVILVLLMTIIVAPFGVLTAIYLHEYAPHNALTMTVRICISNLAAVPSIVYGVFGLGFLVYEVGGNIDALFFSDVLPTPTMGSPGIFWAALTMALLTLPVVTVATEEGLSRVPQGLRRGSYALGATQHETIRRTVLPIASPSIMTGLILAIARAAGEVAPLMLLGAVRFAPNLPIDGSFPYLHLDRQFMHLGVLIYDGAFYSQTSPRGASMMFASCALLLIVVLVLNTVAVLLRHRLRQQYMREAHA